MRCDLWYGMRTWWDARRSIFGRPWRPRGGRGPARRPVAAGWRGLAGQPDPARFRGSDPAASERRGGGPDGGRGRPGRAHPRRPGPPARPDGPCPRAQGDSQGSGGGRRAACLSVGPPPSLVGPSGWPPRAAPPTEWTLSSQPDPRRRAAHGEDHRMHERRPGRFSLACWCVRSLVAPNPSPLTTGR
jgi:hypothetical protein